MNNTMCMKNTIRTLICLLALAGLLSACTAIKGLKLAVHCKTEEALKVLDEAEKGGGLSAKLAILEREAVLREAGRDEEADAVRAKRENDPNTTDKDKAEAEKSIQDTIENIRKEREKQTGSRTCQ